MITLTASGAAITAIHALQLRVRELEARAVLLEDERESLRLRIDGRDFALSRKDAALSKATAKSKTLQNEAFTAAVQLRDARSIQATLQSQTADLNRQFGNVLSTIETTKSDHKAAQAELLDLKRKIADYEVLLGEVISRTSHRPPLTRDEKLLMSSGETGPETFPPSLAAIHRRLQHLPKKVSTMKLKSKLKVARALSAASAAVTDLNNTIKAVECEKCTSSAPQKYEKEITRLGVRLFALSREIKMFEFA
jgi:chromosome segregation ATPase